MNRLITLTLLCVAACAGVFAFGANTARAVEAGELKPDDLTLYNSVTIDCLDVKFKLSRLHQQDGLMRVTLGQSYDTMSTKLMTRLNARVVENKLDGSELIRQAAEFDTKLKEFRADYQKYEVSMNNLMKMDCQSQAQTFYTALVETRELRVIVHEEVGQLNDIAKQYYQDFKEFRKQHIEKQKDENAGE